MQLGSYLRRRDVQRAIAIVVLMVVAALTGKLQDRLAGVPAEGTIEGFPKLVDGDSFHMGSREVRLKGIDAPEGRQSCTRDGRPWSCGEDARAELRRLIAGQKVACRIDETDQHGRMLAYCTAGGRDLNAAMVASGMALSYGGYGREEGEARQARRGLWGSQFQRPREWRREHGVGG